LVPTFVILKLTIVTGGARGLGLVQVGALIEAGAAGVFAFDILTAPDPQFGELQKKYPDQHLEFKRVDVTKSEGLKEHFKKVADWKGRLDGLVAAAGIQYEAPALEYTADDCRRILDVNVPLPPFYHIEDRSLVYFYVRKLQQNK
jgi:NAD(P)-dependent dehydrogenase (short-subunit alcohol dehydrogenase family)